MIRLCGPTPARSSHRRVPGNDAMATPSGRNIPEVSANTHWRQCRERDANRRLLASKGHDPMKRAKFLACGLIAVSALLAASSALVPRRPGFTPGGLQAAGAGHDAGGGRTPARRPAPERPAASRHRLRAAGERPAALGVHRPRPGVRRFLPGGEPEGRPIRRCGSRRRG